MSLQSKVIWLISLVILVYSALVIGAQRLFIMPSFYALEQEESLKNMDRAVQAINREIKHLDASTTDWAFWDDMYQYAQGQNKAFQETNLNELALDGLKVNLLYIFNPDQQLVWGMLYDLESQKEITAPDIADRLKGVRLTEPESTAEGVLLTSLGPMLISARPILTSNRQGPVKGTLIFGQFLNSVSISNEAQIELNATVLDPQKMNPDITSIIAKMGPPGEPYIRIDGDVNRVYQVLPDLDNKPTLLLNVNVPRTISVRGETSVEFAMFSLLGAGLLVLVVLIISLRRMVLVPMKRLTDHAVATGQNDQVYTPLALKRRDEIGILGQEFDRMVERLATARKSLMEQSYQSGMAEVATAVLHNVGNILNSVNVSCTLLMDQLRESRVGNVSKLADMVAEPEGGLGHFLTEDPRGRQIPAYLTSLATMLKEEQQVMFNETASLQGQIEQIKEIVDMQQSYSRVSSVNEIIPPEQLMEDAIKMNADDLARHEVTVQREYQPVPPITVDKHKVLQILLNLISNAKYACTDGQGKEKIITIRIFSSGQNCLSIQVADNGVGILPENLPRIFQYGFTTRKSGHGFGLHSGALAANELGGSLTVHSDGPDLGATFTLELPFHPGDRHET
jgi:sensor domain CHASE-containing protein